jgi:hypothetical protein
MAGGRPTKLTPELLELAKNYVAEGDTMSPTSLLPTVERLALLLNVHRDTLYQWEKENQDFSDILSDLKYTQGDKLIQNSLIGRYNANISKMMLSKHGYVEQTATDITSNGNELGVTIDAAQAEQLVRARAERTNP